MQNIKKKYLSKTIFLWSFCAVLFSVPLLVVSIKNGKWLIGILVVLSNFAVAAILILVGKLRLTKVDKSVHDQEERYSVKFADEEAELLSSNGNVYLAKNWLINLPKWAFYKEYITEIGYERFDSTKSTNQKYCCFIHTAGHEAYTAWVANMESVEKINKWFSEKQEPTSSPNSKL